MPKDFSLKKKKLIDELFKSGRKAYSKNFTIFYNKSDSLKFAYISPKKNFKNANSRNYIKRLIREIIREEILDSLKFKTYNFAILCRNDLKELNFNLIQLELKQLFNTIQI